MVMAPEPETSISELVEAMETMAKAVGAHAICKDKYGCVRVEFPKLPDSEENAKALHVFAELIEATTA